MNWFSFDGRIGRQKFWLALIVLNGVTIAYSLLAMFMYWFANSPGRYVWSILILIVGLSIVGVSSLSFQVRRWRDIGRSGWWCLVGLVPLGAIYAFYMLGFAESVESPVEVISEPIDEAESIETSLTNPAIESLVATYKTLIWNHRSRPQSESLLQLVKEMRDHEVSFSRGLRARLSGVSSIGETTGEIIDGKDSTLAQLISQFGTARATTISVLRGSTSDQWTHRFDDGSTVESLVQNLVVSDELHLKRLGNSAAA